MRSFIEKAILIAFFGTIWGALELFGVDLFHYFEIPNKTAWVYAITLIIMVASKKFVDFPVSVTLMALIASTFKTASTNFFACQVAAVMINGLLFDIGFKLMKAKFESSLLMRSLTGFVLAIISFGVFAFTATFLIREIHWLERGWPGIWEFALTSGLIAASASLLTINIGHWLGNQLAVFIPESRTRPLIYYFYTGSMLLVVGIWLWGQIYRA